MPPVGAVIGREKHTAVHLTHRSAPFAATDRSYGNHRMPPVGAVIGREKYTALYLTHRSAPFAATGRSYMT